MWHINFLPKTMSLKVFILTRACTLQARALKEKTDYNARNSQLLIPRLKKSAVFFAFWSFGVVLAKF